MNNWHRVPHKKIKASYYTNPGFPVIYMTKLTYDTVSDESMVFCALQKSQENNEAASTKEKGACYDVDEGVYCFKKNAAG